MRLKIYVVLMCLMAFLSCEFRKSVNKDLVTGLITKGNGLSCDDVYLSVDEEETKQNTFTYGEKFNLNFNNIEGFSREDGKVFPGMQMVVTNKAGDSIMYFNDLYAGYTDGINLSPLLLQASLTVASPIQSNNEYKLSIKIWDKKGDGIFLSEMPFNVKTNENIKVEQKDVTYNEIYLFSEERKQTITNNKAGFNENIYLLFEGLSGFFAENGKVFTGLQIKAIDNAGNVVLDYDDLFKEFEETGIDIDNFKTQVSAILNFTGNEVNNPIQCEVTVFDKKSDAYVKATTDLYIK